MYSLFIDGNKITKITPRARHAFTLTELAIVLGVIGLILGAIWVAASQAYNNQKVAKASGQILAIMNGYKSRFAQRGVDVPGCMGGKGSAQDVTCMGVHSGFFPSDMLQNGVSCVTGNYSTYPQTPWGGGSYAAAVICQSTNSVNINYYNLSQAACIRLATAIYGNGNVVYQSINDGSAYVDQWLPPIGTGPAWTTAQIVSYCGTGNSNEVQIGFSVK